MPQIFVQKRNEQLEPLNIDKIHRVLQWASDGLDNVSVSMIEIHARLQFYANIKTQEIHQILTKSAADLISEETPNYQFVAARLMMFDLRKQAYKRYEPPHLYHHIKNLVSLKKYDAEILQDYSRSDIEVLNQKIDHTRDFRFTYAGMSQMQGKYLVKNRVTEQVYETPQFLYMLIGACLFAKYPQNTRLKYVCDFYDAVSLFKISLPTPIMAGIRTPTRQFSSCVLIDCDDSLDSINATASAIVRYVSQRAGIGINGGKIRALGASIRSGEAKHTGCIPFYKYFQSAVKSCSQGGVRGGAATLFYPIWHLEIQSLISLKNNRGTEDNRIRHLDYGVQLCGFFYKRLINNQDMTLFCPHDVPELYETFFSDQKRFEQHYLEAENNPHIRKQTISTKALLSQLMQERAQTGRIYIQHVDHCNDHGSFDPTRAAIRQSNLCMEITLPTQPLNDIHDPQGEIALCTLSAFNLGEIATLDEIPHIANLIVRALDSLLDYQNYPVKCAETSTLNRRSLGIGVINYAYFLAKHGYRYSDGSAIDITHQWFERMQFELLKASHQLACEVGRCHWFDHTKYAKGLLPIDHYKPSLDQICSAKLACDWEALRKAIMKDGLRHSTLTALMPAETSAQISNATNGIEPPRALVSIKQSKDGVLKQVVPEIERLSSHYECLWNMPNHNGYLQLCAVMQKFIDQSISVNTHYDPNHYPEQKVPLQTMLLDLLNAYKLGIKTLYYHNTRDHGNAQESDTDTAHCESGACAI